MELVPDFLEQSAEAHPNKTALVCGALRFTYGQLDRRANRLSNALKASGVRRGDRVAIYLNNSHEAVVSIFAALKADAVFVFVNRSTKTKKLIYILNNCQAAAVIIDKTAEAQGVKDLLMEGAGSLRAIVTCDETIAPKRNGDGRSLDYRSVQAHESPGRPSRENNNADLACLIYTSGTTGEPKGVMCDHGNMVFVTDAIIHYLKNTERDIVMNVLPLAFSYGIYQLMAMFRVGGTLVLEPSFSFPSVVMQKMADERVTGFAGVPTIYSILLGMDLGHLDLSSLRYLTNAAAGLPIEHVRRLRQIFPEVELYLMHGLTEVARTMYLPPEQVDRRPGSSGIPMPGTELWVEDENGIRLGPGEVGELIVRGRHVMRGYWMDPELTALRFRPGPLPGERVCHSGDLFRTDEEGYFYFVSRKDDIIKCRGEKIAPREVENVIYTLNGVREAAVIGVPDPVWGQAVKAFVVATDVGLTEAAVISHCKAYLEDFMLPKQVIFRDELPKTVSGKIRKIDLT